MNKKDNFIARVIQERELQRRLWPEPHDTSHSWMEWSAILSKYLGRYSDAACEPYNVLEGPNVTVLEDMETALVKLSAVAMAAYETL